MITSTVAARAFALFLPLALLLSMQPFDARAASGPPSGRRQAAPSGREAQINDLDTLRARINAVISQPRFGAAAWGVKIASLDTGKTLFDHNGGKFFAPASNAKLYTSALALEYLGPDYRFTTSLYSAARPGSSGTLKGDLIIYGRGDPSISTRFTGGDYYAALDPLAGALARAGVRRVEGDLIGDESFFKGPPFGWGWQWDDLQWRDGAEVSALTLNDNVIDLVVKPADRPGIPCRIRTEPPNALVTIINRTQTMPREGESKISVYRPVGENIIYVSGRYPVGSAGYTGKVAIHNPSALFAAAFKEALARRGIAVTGRARAVDWKYREVTPLDVSKVVELGSVQSPPLKDILREVLKPSQNLYAQLLLLQVGASPDNPQTELTQAHGQAETEKTTEERGVEFMNSFMEKIGLKKGEVVIEEGSGLSRGNMITPSATVELLKFMDRHRWAGIFRDSLPVAGVDGTLQNRMKGTAAASNVRAKTGTLRYVYTLSGYATSAAGERLAFSILLNNYYNSDRSISPRDDIDAIAILLTSLAVRE
ncbi:MAG TPA: D-alanyl-D-alanine carboxypeptidase/D-alanyl-D-alanine-endopeptidase [Blastocatellia bacterium]|nr:D-alanyl-D-alanine carboxypeptidase/D-alanyl-D-alanine-endopeptidase [Blastocatellia bacterium]